jgi:thiol-disulfide isomerase/thioredoxin
MAERRRRAGGAPLRALALALAAALWPSAAPVQGAPVTTADEPAPSGHPDGDPYALAFPDGDGKSQSFAQWKGKVLVVNFWATWCAPCVAEMPELEKLQREFGRRGVVIVGLGAENADKVRTFRERQRIGLPLLAGGYDAMSIARNWGDHQGVLPYTAVFSPGGKFLHSQLGPIVPDRLRTWLNAALAEPTAPR